MVGGSDIIFAGHDFPGGVARTIDAGNAIVAPGFVDLDASSDLDMTIFGFDHRPAWRKERIWPRSYIIAE